MPVQDTIELRKQIYSLISQYNELVGTAGYPLELRTEPRE